MEEDSRSLGQHGEEEEGPDGPFVDSEDDSQMDSHVLENQSQGEEEDMVGTLMKQRQKMFAQGGNVKSLENKMGQSGYEKGVHTQSQYGKQGQSIAGYLSEKTPGLGKHDPENDKVAKFAHEKVLRDIKNSPDPKYAEGGEAHMCSGGKCPHYSHGGQVANADEEITGDMPNEFDDLHLDDNQEGHDDSSNEHGDSRQDKDNSDLISQIMLSRKKKDRMPKIA
jgi:hypothetical protein